MRSEIRLLGEFSGFRFDTAKVHKLLLNQEDLPRQVNAVTGDKAEENDLIGNRSLGGT